jgi:hypothetical protein
MKEKVRIFVNENIDCSFKHDSPMDFVISQWQNEEKSVAYLLYRWIFAIFFIFSFFFSFITSITRGEMKVHFIYLTNWNLFATMLMTTLSAALVTLYYANRLKVSDHMTTIFKVYWCFSNSCTMFAVLVSIIYWVLLFPQETKGIDMNNVIIHITNSCVLIIDVFVVKYRPRVCQFIWSCMFGIAYLLVFTVLYPLFGGLNR